MIVTIHLQRCKNFSVIIAMKEYPQNKVKNFHNSIVLVILVTNHAYKIESFIWTNQKQDAHVKNGIHFILQLKLNFNKKVKKN